MIDYPQNLHTHGTYCDGKYEYEDMVKAALEAGLTSIGFSGHSYTSFDAVCCMTREGTKLYKSRIAELRDKYAGIIDIYCGAEFDLYSEDDPTCYDFVIGDVHYIKHGDEFIAIDYSSADELSATVRDHFGGDGLRCAREYYDTISMLPTLAKCDIAGHFDLITKHTERINLFDTESPVYRNYALEAVTAVAESIRVFEINVGAIARGYRSVPYPAPFILRRIKELGCGVVISSDCHRTEQLTANFDTGIELAASCGFSEVLIFTGDGFKGIKI